MVALLGLSSWCLVIVVWLFLMVPWVCLRFVIVVFPDHTHLLLLTSTLSRELTIRVLTRLVCNFVVRMQQSQFSHTKIHMEALYMCWF